MHIWRYRGRSGLASSGVARDWDPLVAWRSKKATREQTVDAIAKHYRELVDLFERSNHTFAF